MERKIGEIFELDGKKLKVEEAKIENECEGCILYHNEELPYTCHNADVINIAGACSRTQRADKKDIIYTEVKQ